MPAYPNLETDATPDLVEVQQETYPRLPVPVKSVSPVTTFPLPSRSGAAYNELLGATMTQILGVDQRRARTILIGDQDWQYARTASDKSGARIPQNVPLVLLHYDQVYAMQATVATNLTVITETYAD